MKLLTVDYPEQSVCQFTFTATAEELETAAQKVYESKRASFVVKGFEKGAANRAEIEADRGEHIFWYDAINDIMDAEVPALYEAKIAELDLMVVSEATYDLVSVQKDEGFTATATFCLLPEFDLGEYKGLVAEASPTVVTEQQIKHYIERKQRLNATLVPHKGPAQKGDTVHITYIGFVDNKPFEGGNADNYEMVLGRSGFIHGFDQGIIGHQAGEAFDLNLEFPKQYRKKELAGKPVLFKVKLIDTCAKELPALNCDFAKKLGNVDTMEEYHEVVRKQLELLRHNNAVNQTKTRIISQIATLSTCALPEPMVTQAYAGEMQQVQQMLQQQNATKAQYLQYLGKTEEEFAEDTKKKAANGVRVNLSLLYIGMKENLVPTQAEIEEEIEKRAAAGKKSVEELKATLDMRFFVQTMTRKRAVDFVLEQANTTITEPVEPAAPQKMPPASKLPPKQ